MTLPAGCVCDTCNNYFSRKLEGPFLNSEEIMALRFHQIIPSKRGRVPPLTGLIDPDIPVTAYRYADGFYSSSLQIPIESVDEFFSRERMVLKFPNISATLEDRLVSRFLAKVALESMAARIIKSKMDFRDGLAYLVDESQLDPVRVYVRYNQGKTWPYSSRRIYDPDKQWTTPSGSVQMVWESDFLVTANGSWYFVAAIFGHELAINLSNPDLDDYIDWLEANGGISPLYINH